MEKEKEKKHLDDYWDDSQFPPERGPRAGLGSSARAIRKISPIGMRVVIKIRRETDRTDSGLYLPEGSKHLMQEGILGEVLEVASALDTDSDEETNISGVPEGALVLVQKTAGVKIPWDEDLRLVETKDVLAIVNEVDVI